MVPADFESRLRSDFVERAEHMGFYPAHCVSPVPCGECPYGGPWPADCDAVPLEQNITYWLRDFGGDMRTGDRVDLRCLANLALCGGGR